jgi:phosphate uptake regulator
LAQEVVARDTELDEMYASCFERILAFRALVTGDARATSAGTQMLNDEPEALERTGDRAADIAAAVRYLA